uniref:Aquarius intron-binding spliceosomal factor n=1 Tax=Petromyzon marinus TaxID=7757 RepID=S4R7P2_PETMA
MATQAVAPKKALAPTVAQINAEYITQLSNQYWAPHIKKKLPFNPKVIEDIYEREMLKTKFAIRKIMLLEFSQYLENYLWPNYTAQTSSKAHLLSICCMLNEKFRENVSAWESDSREQRWHVGIPIEWFAGIKKKSANLDHYTCHAITHSFQVTSGSLVSNCVRPEEVDVIREQVQRLISLPTWVCLLPSRLEQELRKTPKLKKFWNLIKKSDEKLEPKAKEQADYERRFLSRLIQKFVSVLNSIPAKGDVSADKVHYCERFIELMIDLEALLPTRRWFNTLLDDSHLVVLSHLSELAQRPKEGKLFIQLLEMLQFYSGFEINDQSGNALTDHDMTNMHYDRLTSLQRVAFANFPELRDFALSNVASIDTRDSLLKHFGELSTELLHRMAARLNLLPPLSDGESSSYRKEFLVEMMVSRHERRISQIQALNEMPLYPTEKIIWNENIVPTEYFSGDGCLALPKLNLQFLTLHDYLLRNFNLFRLESTYEIRQDVEDAVSRMKPWRVEDGSTIFGGWARMAQTIGAFSVVEVAKPHIGENHPSRVRADITLHLNMRQHIKAEWEG